MPHLADHLPSTAWACLYHCSAVELNLVVCLKNVYPTRCAFQFIVIIATFVTVVSLYGSFAYSLYEALGIFCLIVVNCIGLGQTAYASSTH